MSGVVSGCFVAGWKRAAEILGVQIVSPFCLELPSKNRVDAAVLVKEFGNLNGMLVVTDSEQIKGKEEEVISAKFGYSIIAGGGGEEEFDLSAYMVVLLDWGWWGPEGGEPPWYRELEEVKRNRNP